MEPHGAMEIRGSAHRPGVPPQQQADCAQSSRVHTEDAPVWLVFPEAHCVLSPPEPFTWVTHRREAGIVLMAFLQEAGAGWGRRGKRSEEVRDLSRHRQQVAELGGDLGDLALEEVGRPCPSPALPWEG